MVVVNRNLGWMGCWGVWDLGTRSVGIYKFRNIDDTKLICLYRVQSFGTSGKPVVGTTVTEISWDNTRYSQSLQHTSSNMTYSHTPNVKRSNNVYTTNFTKLQIISIVILFRKSVGEWILKSHVQTWKSGTKSWVKILYIWLSWHSLHTLVVDLLKTAVEKQYSKFVQIGQLTATITIYSLRSRTN